MRLAIVETTVSRTPRRCTASTNERKSPSPELNAFEAGNKAQTGIGRWIGYYNADRPHSTFGGRTPDEVYARQEIEEKLAA